MREFERGQRWTYRTRPGEETSTALILHFERSPDGSGIVSVQLDNLRIQNSASPSGLTELIGHVPVAEDNFDSSVLELIEAQAALPEDESGYQQWLEAFQRGEAGVFPLDLAEIVEAMAQALAAPPANLFQKSRFN